MRMSGPGNELAELLWENGPALPRTAPPLFPPFACSAAGTSRAQELVKHPASTTAMMRDLLLPVQDEEDDDAVPWLHYPIIDGDDDCDTAPLPPEYCPGLLSAGYADLPAPAPATVASTDAGAPLTSHGAVVVPSQEPAVPKQPPRPSGEGVVNFSFFSRPLQRPAPAGERVTASNPVESTVVQPAATNRLRSTPLFSEQRLAWLQPPKESSITAAAPPPAPLVPIRQAETAAALTHRLQPEATRAPEPPPATTSSVCSVNGDRSQLKRSGHHAAEWSVSQEDEDLDDEAVPVALRRSAARSAKRGRTAEVHNMSERRRRDRINEKMRALQELIPNCNKIDKASMLEEAIEYLKTLQLQVQMMSMGTGLCVPPMLLPAAAMQHLQMPPMAHFHHHHLGAMGLAGFGMVAGAFDPRVVAVEQFPCPIIPGAPPMFGLPTAGHAMPSPAAGAHMASVIINNAAAAQAAQAAQTMPSGDPPPRAT